jgi:hypothetical protein
MKLPVLISAVLIAAVVGVAGLAVLHESGSAQSAPRAGVGWQRHLAARGERQLESALAKPTLAARFGAAEGIPAASRRAISRNLHGGKALALRFDKAQTLPAPAGIRLWLVEGRGVACLFVAARPAPASACRTTVQAAEDGISIGTYGTDPSNPGKPTAFLAAGIEPTDVSSLTVAVGEKRRTIPARDGVWAIRAKAPIFAAG